MHSDLLANLRGKGVNDPTWKSWGVTGLDLEFPDVGPLETSNDPLEVRIERAAFVIHRWWRILDGEAFDTSDEISWRRAGVLMEMGYQTTERMMREVGEAPEAPITIELFQEYKRDLQASENLHKSYLRQTHSYDVESSRFLSKDETVDGAGGHDQTTANDSQPNAGLWSYRFSSPGHLAARPGEITGTAECVGCRVHFHFDNPEREREVPALIWETLKQEIGPEVFALVNRLGTVAPTIWPWAIKSPSQVDRENDFRGHCDKYWEFHLELDHLEKAYESAFNARNNEEAVKSAWSVHRKFLDRFLYPAQNLTRQPLSQRSSERESLLVAGWVKAASKMYPRQAKALQFEHGDARRGLLIELPGSVLAAISGDLPLSRALNIPREVMNGITQELHRKEEMALNTEVEIEEVIADGDDFARGFTDAEAELHMLLAQTRLSRNEQAILDLLLQRDYSNSEIATLLGRSESQIKVEKKRAFDKIRTTKTIKTQAA